MRVYWKTKSTKMLCSTMILTVLALFFAAPRNLLVYGIGSPSADETLASDSLGTDGLSETGSQLIRRNLQNTFDCGLADEISEVFDLIVENNQTDSIRRIICKSSSNSPSSVVGSFPEDLPFLPNLRTLYAF